MVRDDPLPNSAPLARSVYTDFGERRKAWLEKTSENKIPHRNTPDHCRQNDFGALSCAFSLPQVSLFTPPPDFDSFRPGTRSNIDSRFVFLC